MVGQAVLGLKLELRRVWYTKDTGLAVFSVYPETSRHREELYLLVVSFLFPNSKL